MPCSGPWDLPRQTEVTPSPFSGKVSSFQGLTLTIIFRHRFAWYLGFHISFTNIKSSDLMSTSANYVTILIIEEIEA